MKEKKVKAFGGKYHNDMDLQPEEIRRMKLRKMTERYWKCVACGSMYFGKRGHEGCRIA